MAEQRPAQLIDTHEKPPLSTITTEMAPTSQSTTTPVTAICHTPTQVSIKHAPPIHCASLTSFMASDKSPCPFHLLEPETFGESQNGKYAACREAFLDL